MGAGVAMKRVVAFLALLALSGCGQDAANSPYAAAFEQIRGGLFNRGEAPSQFTATRASLAEAGITAPVLVVRMPDADISVGLLEYGTNRDVTIWRSLDGNTVSTAAGLLRNTRGFGTDLHSLETEALHHALSQGQSAEYSRLFRALDGEGQLHAIRLYCSLTPEGSETVDILGRSYATRRFSETCHVDGRDTPVFVNTYWQGRDGDLWKSRQWAGPELGYANLERVIN
ncbi:YjbF family lipoprotein [Nioella ostreopsis]|uniref:YjbF family lipoprotein n=1 Tax=Nioella ostreopsis TaxID=2448479 RepID=UPI000FD79B56|nr:YjbF family lipoprotein [Nioella ostreopsis]